MAFPLSLFIAVQSVCFVGLLTCIIQLIRIGRLSRAVHGHIDRVYEERMALIRSGRGDESFSIPYPNIEKTYANLKWYKPWERPSTLVEF